ncbi:MAG: dihydroorotase [Deltaproteobacteria bacterium]|nr:dihydroorotase [Deltaproteobacteria bacterium]
MTRYLLAGGRVIDPSRNIDEVLDILVEKGTIAKVGKNLSPSNTAKRKTGGDVTVLDLHGMLVVPGLIDMHVHLREPGFEYKETIRSGSEAASAGGFTAVACMPNTSPVNDNRSVTEFIRMKAAACGLVRVYPIAAISRGMEGTSLAEFGDLADAGAVAFSDDGKPVMNGGLMRRALEYAASLDMPVISHCEDVNLSAEGAMNEGFAATELGLPGIPSAAEEVMVARDIILAGFTGTAVHIAHVSTAGSVQMIREAKARGIRVTAETAPHYFTLTDDALREFDTNTRVNPPLRGREDLAAIREGLSDGTIDVIATDHAPHARTDKEVEFEYAASGIAGLETALPLSLKLFGEGVLPLDRLIRVMSTNPAGILRIPGGTLAPGAEADITVIDLNGEWTVEPDSLRSQGKNTPFAGWAMKGKAVMTMVGGEIKLTTP